jgi:hypothetical protein
VYPDLDAAIGAVMAEWDTPATRQLCLDCWVYARDHGEAGAVALCRVLLAGVKDYRAYLDRINAPLYAAPRGAST